MQCSETASGHCKEDEKRPFWRESMTSEVARVVVVVAVVVPSSSV